MQTVPTWRTVEFSFESSRDVPIPSSDVDLEAIFTGPGGVEIRRPAFWDGGRTWRVRFAPTLPGVWHYALSSTNGLDTGFLSSTGVLRSVDNNTDHAIYRHGFLRKGPSGRYLAHADNTPFFWLGDTHWRFTFERWEEANKPGWSSQFRGMVDTRVQQGFTVYQTNLMLFDWSSKTSSYWMEGKLFREINVAFFQTTVDPRMAYIANQGLVNALGLGWYAIVDENLDGVKRFARYIVARYGSYPMVWTLGGEVAGYEPDRRQSRIDGWREVALTIQAADGYNQPRTAHTTNERPIAPYYQGEDWLTLTLNQHGHGDFDMHAGHYHDYLATYPGTPLVEGESMYEGLLSVEYQGRRPVTDTMVRHVAYRAMQSGCCGYTYGAQGCWNAAWDRDDSRSMWGALPWYEGIDLPGAEQLSHMRRFYEEVGWIHLRPFMACFSAESIFNHTIYAPLVTADPEMDTVVIFFGETYRSSDGMATLSLLKNAAYRLQWFDPRTGLFVLIAEQAQPVNGTLVLPAKPDGRDWVFLAQAGIVASRVAASIATSCVGNVASASGKALS
jgi:hypothetical protein